MEKTIYTIPAPDSMSATIFGLRRPDVLSLGDAGLQRAARLLFGDDAKLERVGQSWQPFRSVASWYLWRHLDA